MSVKALSEYTRYSKYSRYLPEKKRRETWQEQVERVFDMHKTHLGDKYDAIKEEFAFAKQQMMSKRILGSQRALQFGGTPILNKHAKQFNCSASYADRVRVFQELIYLLLCGCGVGMSVQRHHIEKLPNIFSRDLGTAEYVVEDSIEGWANAVGAVVNSYFRDDAEYEAYFGKSITFDYSKIRPAGAPISWGGVAPGPSGLRNAITKIESIFNKALSAGQNKLKPINVYDIFMHEADSVLSGGIRRSATIMLFSPDDVEMATAKTGSWFIENPQRGRSNNSALLIRNSTTKEEFETLMNSVKEYGEPGFVWADNKETLFNPCVEISLYGYSPVDGKSGFEFCNLTTINAKKAKTKEEFLESCRASAILGTIQASYNKFAYLSKASEEICNAERLLGCSITGMMDNPAIALDPEIQRAGAELIKEVNKEVALKLGINQAARTTCIKPEGSASCLLGSSSGIHPNHAKRYIRRVQANKLEFPVNYFKLHNPRAVEESVWSANKTDYVIAFLCDVPDGARLKSNVTAVDLLKIVQSTQQNWVIPGTNVERCLDKSLRQNVSNTISVKNNEWQEVTDYIYENRAYFAGISLLPASGDLDYPQAPFTTVLTETEIVKEFGEGTLFASGLIVDGLSVFDDNLWAACDSAIGIGNKYAFIDPDTVVNPKKPIKGTMSDKKYAEALQAFTVALANYYEETEKVANNNKKVDWIRRFKQFADRYVAGDLRKTTHLLKHVHNWKLWLDLKREYTEVDWGLAVEEDFKLEVNSLGGEACSGGACETGALGAAIKEKNR